MYCRTTALDNNLLKSTNFLVFTFFIRNKPAVGTKCDTENRKLEKFIKTLVKYSIMSCMSSWNQISSGGSNWLERLIKMLQMTNIYANNSKNLCKWSTYTLMRDTHNQLWGFGFAHFENASSIDDIIASKKDESTKYTLSII